MTPADGAARTKLPLAARVIIGVAIGTALGIGLGTHGTSTMGDIGMLVIRLLKTLAAPLILFAVLDALLRTSIPARKGAQLIAISLVNALVATVLGLGLANVLHSGRGAFAGVAASMTSSASSSEAERPATQLPASEGAAAPTTAPSTTPPASATASGAPTSTVTTTPPPLQVAVPKLPASASASAPASTTTPPAKKSADDVEPTLDPLKNIMGYVPENLVDPFRKNAVISIVLLALLVGLGLRSVKNRGSDQAKRGILVVEDVIHAGLQTFTTLLSWIVQLVPFAVLGVVASVVGKSGWQVLLSLGSFLGTMLLGLFIHAVVYYSILLVTVGRTSPLRFFAGAADAIVTALSASSSLATLPVTLRCLNDNLRVSPSSARLAACVGTNLNHDGIILYEACATLFVAQAFGYELTAMQQVTVAFSSVMAGIGIAGVPEAGLITLPLVLSAAGLPPHVVALVVPLILPVDWIIGRCRAATNVISDMTVATLLDRFSPDHDETVKIR